MGGWHQASVLSACFADLGYRVIGVADEEGVVTSLNNAQSPVFEPGLDEMIRRNLRAGRLKYTSSYHDGLRDAEFVFLSIDTPVGPNDESDMDPILATARAIISSAPSSSILCVTSQVPVGTCRIISHIIPPSDHRQPVDVAYVPEFLRLGTAIETFLQADRFVIGADSPKIAERVAAIYRPLRRPILLTDLASAEMAKHASNAFLATSISFINEIADLCEATGANATEVAKVMKLDRRIGPHAFLSAGLGYAGGTLGREMRALHHLGERHQVKTRLVDAAHEVNTGRLDELISRIREAVGGVSGRRIAVLGLTYKSGTSTLRRSVALELVDRLRAEGAHVSAFDPLARGSELDRTDFRLCPTPETAAHDATALVLISPWPGMSAEDVIALGPVMRRRLLFDTGNYMKPDDLTEAGFEYRGVGR